jgi:hypothetical protein
MREFATGFCTPWRVDDGENECVHVMIYGPGGGTRFSGIMRPEQVRTFRDELDLALTRLADRRAREKEPDPQGSIDHMPERNSDDAVDDDGCPTWSP